MAVLFPHDDDEEKVLNVQNIFLSEVNLFFGDSRVHSTWSSLALSDFCLFCIAGNAPENK